MKNKNYRPVCSPHLFVVPSFTIRRLCSFASTRLLAGVVALLLSHASAASAETWNLGAGGSWNAAGSWNPASIPSAVGANATFNNAASGLNPAQTGNRTVTADAAQTVGSINFNNDAANAFTMSITAGTGGSLTFDETAAGPATITVAAVVGTGNNTISAPIILTDSLTAIVNHTTPASSAGALNLTAVISGPGGFTKQGLGLATFGTGAKTYGGPTVLSGGRMRMSSAASATATSSFTINTGAQLTLITAATYTFGSGPMNLNGAGPTSGPFAPFPGAIRNDTGIAVTINNAVVLQSDSLLHVQGSASGSLTLPNTVSGSGKLTLTSTPHDANLGTLTLNGANTYAGGTVVDGGTLVASGATATLGTGDVTVNSANLAFSGASAKLTIETGVLNAIADTAQLSLTGGNAAGVADDGYADLGAGVNEVVGGLRLGGVGQPAGTYGSTTSGAMFQNDEFFSGTGIVTVVPPTLTIIFAPPAVVIAWPTNVTGYTLQELAAFAAINYWSNVNASVVVSGTNNTVTVPATNNDFFRLIK